MFQHVLAWCVRLFYLPVFLLVGNGAAVYLIAEGYNKAWVALLLLLFIGISFVCERLVPYDQAFNEPKQDKERDLLHSITNEALNVVGVSLLPIFGSLFVVAPIWPHDWPLAAQLVLAVLIADVGITLAHYASHRIKHLWRLHAVHHSTKRLYGFNGLMKHPLHQLIETIAGTTPLLFIGVSQEVLVLLVVAVVLQLLLQHSNVDYFTGPLKKVLAINSVHRFHHLSTAEEGDVNFGLFTTITDRLLGTAYFDPQRKIGSDDLGIDSEPNYPTAYWQQLKQPFNNS